MSTELIKYVKHYHPNHFKVMQLKNKYGVVWILEEEGPVEVSFFDTRGYLLSGEMQVKDWDTTRSQYIVGNLFEIKDEEDG